MKASISSLVISSLVFSVVACSTSSTTNNKNNGYVSKSNGSFQLRPYKEKTLENGLKIIFIADHTLPRVSLSLLVKAGALQETAANAGLNAMTAYLMEQGTQSRDALKIADEFGQLGSSLDVSPGYDFTTFFADCLVSSKETLLPLFADIIMNPSFKDVELQRIRAQILASLQKKVDNPSSYADDRLNAYLFGAHPYGTDVNGTKVSVSSLRKQAVIKHFLTFYRPNNATLAVVGSFDEAFEKQVQDVFGKWTKRTIPALKVAMVPASDSLQVQAMVKRGLQQTQIRLANLGISRKDPDYLTLRLANEVLGGSFASRLNQRIRDDQGLTYSIYSNFDVKLQRGSFEISTFTKNETVGKTLEETLKVVQEFVDMGVTQKELEAAKSQLIGQFPRAIETADRFAYNLLALDFYGIPVSYLTDFNSNVRNISLGDVNAVIKKHVTPQKMKVLVYGDEKILPQLTPYKPQVLR